MNRELGSRSRSACVAWTGALVGWVAVCQANAQSASPLPQFNTGFLVAKNVVVTTAHSVEGCRTVQLGQPGQALATADDVQVDSERDVALARVSLPANVEALTLSSGKAFSIGDAIYAIGFPFQALIRGQPSFFAGVIAGLGGIKNDPQVFRIDFVPLPGMSGAAVVNSSGEVEGMIKTQLIEFAPNGGPSLGGEGFAISETTIADVLRNRGVHVKESSSTEHGGVRTLSSSELASRMLASTVVVMCHK